MKQKLKQIWFDMRHQPVVAGVTLLGTTMSIFLIMVVMMMHQVKVMPFAPESCRDRLLIGSYIHMVSDDGDSSAGLNYATAQKIYDGLEGIETTSYMTLFPAPLDVVGPPRESFMAKNRKTDAAFWDIFDHQLIDGRFYTPDEAASLSKVAVITESTARRLFGTEPVIGNTFMLDHENYRLVGVIRDHSLLAQMASGDVFTPTGAADPYMSWDKEYWGRTAVALLMKPGVDAESVRTQVRARYAIIDTELAPSRRKTVYHEQPFDQEMIAAGIFGSNQTPDVGSERLFRIIIYLVLLIVPAINLSTMLHSRLRRRISEIGVKRAFGCTRSRIIVDIIAENFIVTLAGGIIGLALGIIFATTYSGLYDEMTNFGSDNTPMLSTVLNFSTIAMAVMICFILNLISAAVPAWYASRINPVEAINAQK